MHSDFHRWGKRKTKLSSGLVNPLQKYQGQKKCHLRPCLPNCGCFCLCTSGIWEDSRSVMVKQRFLLVCWARSSFLMDTGPQILRPDLLKLWPPDFKLKWVCYLPLPVCFTSEVPSVSIICFGGNYFVQLITL